MDDAAAWVGEVGGIAADFVGIQQLGVEQGLLAPDFTRVFGVVGDAAGVVDVARVGVQGAHGMMPGGELVGAVR